MGIVQTGSIQGKQVQYGANRFKHIMMVANRIKHIMMVGYLVRLHRALGEGIILVRCPGVIAGHGNVRECLPFFIGEWSEIHMRKAINEFQWDGVTFGGGN